MGNKSLEAEAKTERRRASRLAVRLAATALVGVMGLFLAELVARALDLAPPPRPEREGEILRSAADPRLIFEPRPDSKLRVLYRERRGDAPRVVEMHVNAQGFRGPLALDPKPEGALRIACIGDSHTFGWGVEEHQTWPAHLARALRSAHPEREVEVLNCGVNDYDTVQEVLWLRQRVLPYAPDLVVLQFYVNDAVVRGVRALRPPEPDRLMLFFTPGRGGRMDALRARSRFLDLVSDAIYRRRGLRFYAAQRGRHFEDDEPGWVQVREALVEARDELAARDIPFLVALYPFLLREGKGLGSRGPFRKLMDFLDSEGIPYVDAEPAFLGRDVDRLRISAHDYHGNGEANAIFARAVLEGLEREPRVRALIAGTDG